MSATTTAIAAATSTAVAEAVTDSIYYESWVAIMSTFGIFNTFVGLLVIGILGVNRFIIVSMANSLGAAFAYGLAWMAYYGPYSTRTKVAASVSADVFWLIQEASLSFYSFFIVRTLIRGRERMVYHAIFWFLELAICGIRMPIMACRVILARHGDDPALQVVINRLHMGYFISIALCESWNAYFLIKKFRKARARRQSISHPMSGGSRRGDHKARWAFRGGLYSQLARSSEIRLASLASVGIFRAVTFSFQVKAESATNFPTQLDHFAACVETMFSTIFIVDVLASKLAFQEQQKGRGNSVPTDHSARNFNPKRHNLPETFRSYQVPAKIDLNEMGAKATDETSICQLNSSTPRTIDSHKDDSIEFGYGKARSEDV